MPRHGLQPTAQAFTYTAPSPQASRPSTASLIDGRPRLFGIPPAARDSPHNRLTRCSLTEGGRVPGVPPDGPTAAHATKRPGKYLLPCPRKIRTGPPAPSPPAPRLSHPRVARGSPPLLRKPPPGVPLSPQGGQVGVGVPRNVISPDARENPAPPGPVPGATGINPGSSGEEGKNSHDTLLRPGVSVLVRVRSSGIRQHPRGLRKNPAGSGPHRKISRHIESIPPSLVAQRRPGGWKSEPPQRPATRDMVIYRRKNTNPTNCMKRMRIFGPFSVAIRSHDGKPRSLGCRKTPPRRRSGSGVFPAPSATGLSCQTRQPPAHVTYEKPAAIHAVIAH
ncbi:hypothetical protein TSACC_2836 [Terrimicrobium sacchariphilum]|uniref:Uncharacterized protein n=1 Tax=Terrimicrobium sacchariphilum TaxID=690879 RepID=A0A146G6M4_TERSA|nr:hypothetical protein TSACC_2836 [Terrimicrobium sacchariphilum]